MAENSKIEWTDHTFNPWVGCSKVGPPCDNCYAEAWAKRSGHPELWQGERRRTTDANWRQPIKWNEKAKAEGIRRRVFCCSLADWLDNKAPNQWREDLACLIDETPHLDWLLLTKRIQNFDKRGPWHHDNIPANVWLGITCGDQAEYDRDWPILREIKAPIRFISHEPSLGCLWNFHTAARSAPDWVIVGGESGAGARMMDPEWARTTMRNCKTHGISYFFKQMTGKKPIPPDLMVREFPR